MPRTRYKPKRPARAARPAPADPPAFFRWLYPVAILIVCGLAFAYIFDEKLDLNGDNASYYVLGQAIAQGKGYVNLADPNQSPASHYPPGYPFIIGVLMMVGLKSITTVKVVNGLMLTAAAVVLYALFGRFTRQRALAFVAVVFLILNAGVLRYATIMMSEVPFLLFSSLCLFFFVRYDAAARQGEGAAWWRQPDFYLMLLCLGASYYIRSAGLALFGGLMLYLLLSRRWVAAGATLGAFVLMALPWYLRGKALGGNSYVGQLLQVNPYRPELGAASVGDLIERVLNNAQRYLTKEIPAGVLPFYETQYQETTGGEWLLGLVVVGLIAYGLYRLPAYRLLVLCYLGGTFGILLLWPEVWYGIRFVLAVVPLLTLACLYGTYALACLGLQRAGVAQRFNPLVLLVAVVFALPYLRQLHEQAEARYPPNWRNYFELARYVERSTPPETIVSARKPIMFYLFAQRPTVNFANTPDDQALIRDLEERGVSLVVLEQLGFGSTARYLYPAIQKNPARFALVQQLPSPDTYLLKLNR